MGLGARGWSFGAIPASSMMFVDFDLAFMATSSLH